MRIAGLFLLIAISGNAPRAAEVVMVTREFPMSNRPSEIPADVYINQSHNVGDLIAVARRVFVKIPEDRQKLIGINIPFCLLRILYSENSISVGRVVYFRAREELPLIEHYGPIVGDVVVRPEGPLMDGYRKEGRVTLREDRAPKRNQDPIQKTATAEFEIVL